MTTVEQKNLILNILDDVASDGGDAFITFARHVGFDVCTLRSTSDLTAAWLGHYRLRQGVYDVERAARDFATWPPVAQRIEELRIAFQSSTDDL
jgi:hypothetical protein